MGNPCSRRCDSHEVIRGLLLDGHDSFPEAFHVLGHDLLLDAKLEQFIHDLFAHLVQGLVLGTRCRCRFHEALHLRMVLLELHSCNEDLRCRFDKIGATNPWKVFQTRDPSWEKCGAQLAVMETGRGGSPPKGGEFRP